MTRQYNQVFTCANCGCTGTTETSFGRWVRNNPDLDSQKHHVCIYDIDYIVHKYKTHHGRTFQLMMLLEVKTRNSDMTDAQRDTLYMLSQLTQNRKRNKSIVSAAVKDNANDIQGLSFGSTKVWSPMRKAVVSVKSFGFFKLQFSNLGPDDSDEIKWNDKTIDASTLTSLLNFDIDPVCFRPISELFRVHHKQKQLPLLHENGIFNYENYAG
jgi:hypothetical protein